MYGFLHPIGYQSSQGDTLISQWLLGSFLSSPITQAISATLLVYSQGTIINMIANSHRIYRIPSSMSGMVYVFLVSALPELQILSPALIGMTFVLLASFSIFNTYKQAHATAGIFNAALSGAVAVLFYPPYAVLFIAFIIGLGMLRSFGLREKFQYILAYLVPFWIVGGAFYSFGWLDFPFFSQVDVPGSISDVFLPNYYIILGVLVLIAISLFNNFNYKKKKVIEVRKKIDFLYWSLLSAFIALMLFSGLDIQHVLYVSFGLSIFLGMSLANMRSAFLAEMIHMLLIVGVIAIQYLI